MYVDVRDLAQAQVLAYENPKAANQRFLISNGNYNWQEVVDAAHKYFPNQTKAQKGDPGQFPKPVFSIDNSKSKAVLGLTYTPKEVTIRDTVTQLVNFEKQGK